jgi:hypothetical protein
VLASFKQNCCTATTSNGLVLSFSGHGFASCIGQDSLAMLRYLSFAMQESVWPHGLLDVGRKEEVCD